MSQPRAGTFDNGKAQAKAVIVARLGVQPMKFLENPVLILLGDSGPGVPYLDPGRVAISARADDNPPGFGIADRVGEKVLNDPPQIGGVGLHHLRAVCYSQRQAFLRGQKFHLVTQGIENFAQGNWADVKTRAVAFQFRDIEQGVDDLFRRTKRGFGFVQNRLFIGCVDLV